MLLRNVDGNRTQKTLYSPDFKVVIPPPLNLLASLVSFAASASASPCCSIKNMSGFGTVKKKTDTCHLPENYVELLRTLINRYRTELEEDDRDNNDATTTAASRAAAAAAAANDVGHEEAWI